MTKKKPTTFTDHQRAAVQARWAKTTPEQRSAYAKMMVKARQMKRARLLKEAIDGCCLVQTTGPNGEPMACGFLLDHAGKHSWQL